MTTRTQTTAQFLAELDAYEVPFLLTDSAGREFPTPPEVWEKVHGGERPQLFTLRQPYIDGLAREYFKC